MEISFFKKKVCWKKRSKLEIIFSCRFFCYATQRLIPEFRQFLLVFGSLVSRNSQLLHKGLLPGIESCRFGLPLFLEPEQSTN